MLQTKRISNGGVSLSYIVGPDNGPAILFLHGIAGSAESYQPVLDELASIAHVFALSFRGHGSSDDPGPPYGVSEYTSDAIALLESEIRSPAVIAGHSLGGLVAVRIAATRPGLVREVILEDPPLFAASAERRDPGHPTLVRFALQRDLMRQHRHHGLSEQAALERLGATPIDSTGKTMLAAFGEQALRLKIRELFQADPEVLSEALDRRLGFNAEETLKLVRCRVTLFSGEEVLGSPLTEDDIQRTKALVNSLRHVPVPDVGHFIRFDARDLYLGVVRERLAANRGS
jgi:pimeloyl-ACP methyl ester carboxylesterase